MAEVKIPSDPANYPNNSITARARQEEREKVESVVKGKAIKQKETLGRKFKRLFMPGDIKDAKSYVIEQVLIPGLKNGALAAVEMLFFGQVSGRFQQRPGVTNRNNQTAYDYISTTGARVGNRSLSMPRTKRETFSFQDIFFVNYDDASAVVEAMVDILDRLGVVAVGDFYTLCGIGTEYTDYDWGWKSLTKLEPRRIRDGYVIDMTPPVYLK